MINRLRIAIPVVAVLVVASMAAAKEGGIPKLNIEYACHASEQAVSAIVSVTNDIYKSCLDDENEARNQLNDAWAKFSASDKVQCIHSSEFLPSYVEWLTCLEMTRDVKQMRKSPASDPHQLR